MQEGGIQSRREYELVENEMVEMVGRIRNTIALFGEEGGVKCSGDLPCMGRTRTLRVVRYRVRGK